MKAPRDLEAEADRTPPDGMTDPSDLRPPHSAVDDGETEPHSTAKKRFDPYRFAATTLPPGLRAKLIAAKLPVVPREQLEDTAPPNGHSLEPQVDDTQPDQRSLMDTDPARWVRRRNRRRAFLAAAALTFLLLFVAVFVWTRPQPSPEATVPPIATLASPAMETAYPEPTAIRRAEPSSTTPATAAPEPKPSPSSSAGALARHAEHAESSMRPNAVPRVAQAPFPTSGLEAPAIPEPSKKPAPAPPKSGNPLDRLIVAPASE